MHARKLRQTRHSHVSLNIIIGKTMSNQPRIILRAETGDTKFECPVCGWSVTLTPEGVALWTESGTIEPRCKKDNVALTQTVIR